MPNWVFNSVSVTGDEKAVTELREQLRKPVQVPAVKGYQQVEPLTYKEETPEWISFQNVIPIPADILDEYHSACDSEGIKSANNWYKWNSNNWGCKWDANETDGTFETENGISTLFLSFDTPWGQPQPIINWFVEFCEANDLHMYWTYREEQGWGGSITVDFDGEVFTDEYDIPDSHADFVERGDVEFCHCAEGDEEFWFDDCPKKEGVN
jgi:hypothetical protein